MLGAALVVLAEVAVAGTLLPPPQRIQIQGSSLTMSANVGLEGSNASTRMTFLLDQLQAGLASGGFAVTRGNASLRPVSIRFQRLSDASPSGGLPSGVAAFPNEGDEGYVISIAPKSGGLTIVVGSTSERGLWNGAMTLRQMLLSDAGPRETTLAPQLVHDYADQPIRGATPGDLSITGNGVSATQITALDTLARRKFNVAFFPSMTLATAADQWASNRVAFAALQRAAADRFIELVPTLGTLQSDWAPTYRDGWWISREPMFFESATQSLVPLDSPVEGRRRGSVVGNGGFEQWSSGVPIAWTLTGSGLPGVSFTRDTSVKEDGTASLRVDATGGHDGVSLRQTVIGPHAPGHYLVSAQLRFQDLTGTRPTIAAQAASGSTLFTPSRRITPYAGTYDWDLWSGILRIPPGPMADRIEISIGWATGTGTLWIDDLRIERIDTDLRNVMRDAKDVVLTSANGSTVYRPGIDYTVVDGTFDDVYTNTLTPTHIVRLAGSAAPQNTPLLLSYDKNLYPGVRIGSSPRASSRVIEQGINLCASRTQSDLYQPALLRLLLDLRMLNPDLPIRSIFLAGDEIRGFNRSGACRAADGSLLQSNAERLATFLNDVIDYGKSLQPDIVFYLWGDMLSPGHNGNTTTYQIDQGYPGSGRDSGGSRGMTTCALAPSAPGCAAENVTEAIDPALRPISWISSTATVFHKAFSADFFRGLERPWIWASLSEVSTVELRDQGIRDSAAIAAASQESLGSLDAFEVNDAARQLKASLAWNPEWAQVYYEPFEFGTRSIWGFAAGRPTAGSYSLTSARMTSDETCAAPYLLEPQEDKTLPAMNAGGVCIDAASGSLRTPYLPIDNSLQYRVSFRTKLATVQTGTLRLRWRNVGVADTVQNVSVSMGASDGNWIRSSVDLTPRTSPTDPFRTAVSFEFIAPAAARLDDLMLWEERPGCPQGNVAGTLENAAAAGGGVGSPLQVTLQVANEGCRDLVITGASSFPGGALIPPPTGPFPIVLLAGESRSLTLSGTMPTIAVGDTLLLRLVTNDSTSTLLSIPLSYMPTACGLLGIEPCVAIAAALAWRRRGRALRNSRKRESAASGVDGH